MRTASGNFRDGVGAGCDGDVVGLVGEEKAKRTASLAHLLIGGAGIDDTRGGTRASARSDIHIGGGNNKLAAGGGSDFAYCVGAQTATHRDVAAGLNRLLPRAGIKHDGG